jgi:hypothetical protein
MSTTTSVSASQTFLTLVCGSGRFVVDKATLSIKLELFKEECRAAGVGIVWGPVGCFDLDFRKVHRTIGRPTSSVAQANLTIKINFDILRSFSSSNILTIYLQAFLQSLHPFEKTAFKVSHGISARITRIQARSSDGISARYPINFPLT